MDKELSYLRNPQLDGSPFFWQEGPTAILCIHGFSATTVEVRKIAIFLRDHGYTTMAPLLPGHGSSPAELNQTTWHDWVSTAEESLANLKQEYERIFVLGESMGALVSLHLMANYPELLGGMLFAPALKIPNLWLSKLLWPFKASLRKGPPNESIPQQSYRVFPLKAASSLYEFQKIVRKELRNIQEPVILFQGTQDKTIDPTGAVEAYEQIGSDSRELVVLRESEHIILLDRQLPEVQQKCLEFILRNSGELA